MTLPTTQNTNSPTNQAAHRLIASLADRFGVDENKLYTTVKRSIMKTENDDEVMAFLFVAAEYKLNPFVKEIHAFSGKGGGVVPIVGIDGWVSIVNRQPQYSGHEYRFSPESLTMAGAKPCPEWIECVMHRKDRDHSVIIREYLDECFRPTEPWKTMTKRMLRHKAYMQCARVAFGLSGIYDEDEAKDFQGFENAKDITPRPERSAFTGSEDAIDTFEFTDQHGESRDFTDLNLYAAAFVNELKSAGTPEVADGIWESNQGYISDLSQLQIDELKETLTEVKSEFNKKENHNPEPSDDWQGKLRHDLMKANSLEEAEGIWKANLESMKELYKSNKKAFDDISELFNKIKQDFHAEAAQ